MRFLQTSSARLTQGESATLLFQTDSARNSPTVHLAPQLLASASRLSWCVLRIRRLFEVTLRPSDRNSSADFSSRATASASFRIAALVPVVIIVLVAVP